jgi:hypothetical protein
MTILHGELSDMLLKDWYNPPSLGKHPMSR